MATSSSQLGVWGTALASTSPLRAKAQGAKRPGAGISSRLMCGVDPDSQNVRNTSEACANGSGVKGTGATTFLMSVL